MFASFWILKTVIHAVEIAAWLWTLLQTRMSFLLPRHLFSHLAFSGDWRLWTDAGYLTPWHMEEVLLKSVLSLSSFPGWRWTSNSSKRRRNKSVTRCPWLYATKSFTQYTVSNGTKNKGFIPILHRKSLFLMPLLTV